MKRLLAAAVCSLLLFCFTAWGQYVTYWFQGWQRQGDAHDAQEYFMRPGTNIVFTYASNRVYINAGGVITNTVVTSNAIWSYFAGTATNWLGSNDLWLILQTNTFSTNSLYSGTATNWLGSNALSVFSTVLCAGSNVVFTTNGGCFTINASGTGGGSASNVYFTNVFGVAPGTNVTFTTNAGIVYINSVSNATPGTNITSNLLAWWRFDEGTGTNTTDWTGNGNTGWLTNFTGGVANNPTWVSGKIGAYAIFLRTNLNQIVAVPTLVTQRPSGSITWWQWQTNVYNSGGIRGMWGWYPAGTPPEWDCQVYLGPNSWYIGGGNAPETRLVIPADANNWPTNDWIHYAFTWGTNGQSFYANGVLLTNTVFTSSTNRSAGDYFHIGSLGKNGAYFSGAFDDFRIYTTNLTSAEIANLYQYYIDHMGDTNFVMKSGDTMTGPLTINTGALTVQDTIYANSNVIVGGNALTIAYDSANNKSVFTVAGNEVLAVRDDVFVNGSVYVGRNNIGWPIGTPASVGVGLNSSPLDNAVAVGNLATAWTNAVSVGPLSTADDYGIAVGNGANVAKYAIGIGGNSAASVDYSIAIGESAAASDGGSIAIGTNATATGPGFGGNAIAIGPNAQATGSNSVAIGANGDPMGGYAGVAASAYEAIELGSGSATTPGALHYRGVPICDMNGVLMGSFSGNGYGLTNIDLSAITNAWWLTNGYPWTNLLVNASNVFWENREYDMNHANLTNLDEVDAGLFLATGPGFLGNGQYLTNIYATNLAPNSGVAILASNNYFTASNDFQGTGFHGSNIVHRLESGSANTLVVTNGRLGIGKSNPSFTVDINGTLGTSSDISSGGGLALNSGFGWLYSPVRNMIRLVGNNAAPFTNLVIGAANTGATNCSIRFFHGTGISPFSRPTIVFVNGDGTSEDVNIGGSASVTNGIVCSLGAVTATNLLTSFVKWIDIPMNYSYSTLGPSAPSLTATTNNSVIQELAFDNNDILYAQAQMQHNVATTNAAFPAWYFEPHVHFTTIGTLDSTHSNVTWRIEWEFAKINGGWTSGTNTVTMGVTNNYTHYMAELGHLTNNSVPHLSSIFRCRLTRPASAGQDYSNAHDVLLDGFDLHIPVGNQNAIGSSIDNAP